MEILEAALVAQQPQQERRLRASGTEVIMSVATVVAFRSLPEFFPPREKVLSQRDKRL